MLRQKKYALVFLMLCFTFGVFSQQVEVTGPLRFLALGDSYTIGEGVSENERWPNQLAVALQNMGVKTEKVNIIARTGWRTDNLLGAAGDENLGSDYNLVSLLIGVNNQFQRVNIDVYPVQFRALLEKAIMLCGGRKEGVFVLSIPDYGFTPFGISDRASISAEIDQYNQINRNIANEMGIAYFDITPISREVITKPEYLAGDNLHPSGTMYLKWVELIINSSGFKIITSNKLEYNLADKINLYPNPFDDRIYISSQVPMAKVILFDLTGRKLIERTLNNKLSVGMIDLQQLKKGIFLLQVTDVNNKIQTIKVSKP